MRHGLDCVGGEPLRVAPFAGQLFFRLWRASHTRTEEVLVSIGLTPALFALLNVLGAREGAIQQQLSSDMGIDPSAMVKLINELESASSCSPFCAGRSSRPNLLGPRGTRTERLVRHRLFGGSDDGRVGDRGLSFQQ